MPAPNPAPAARLRRGPRRSLIAGVVFVVALEVVLQAGALMAWALRPRSPAAAGAAVLCVGDSYTWGIGASAPQHGYPAQLAERLAALGHGVRVHNGGTPGEDSAHVLRVLPHLLQPGTRVVCVMLGTNDAWSRPALVPPDDAAADPDAFVLRWRTGRLLALLTRFASGTWQQQGEPTTAGTRAQPALHDVAAGLELLVTTGFVPTTPELPVLPQPCPADLEPRLAEARARLQRGDATAALAAAQVLLAAHADVRQVQQLVAEAASRAGDEATAAAALQQLERAAAAGDATAAEAHLGALLALERLPEVVAAAQRRLAAEPRAILARQALLAATFVLGDWATFRREAPPALALAPLDPLRAARLGRELARVIAAQEPERAAVLVLASTLLDGDDGLTRATLAKLQAAVPAAAFDAALGRLPARRAERTAALRALLAGSRDPAADVAWPGVLREHLRRIDALVRSRGARTVLLTYPFHQPAVEAAQRDVAAELDLPLVEVRTVFDAELAHRARHELFVADGHCNDAGYARIADLAAPVVATVLSR